MWSYTAHPPLRVAPNLHNRPHWRQIAKIHAWVGWLVSLSILLVMSDFGGSPHFDSCTLQLEKSWGDTPGAPLLSWLRLSLFSAEKIKTPQHSEILGTFSNWGSSTTSIAPKFSLLPKTPTRRTASRARILRCELAKRIQRSFLVPGRVKACCFFQNLWMYPDVSCFIFLSADWNQLSDWSMQFRCQFPRSSINSFFFSATLSWASLVRFPNLSTTNMFPFFETFTDTHKRWSKQPAIFIYCPTASHLLFSKKQCICLLQVTCALKTVLGSSGKTSGMPYFCSASPSAKMSFRASREVPRFLNEADWRVWFQEVHFCTGHWCKLTWTISRDQHPIVHLLEGKFKKMPKVAGFKACCPRQKSGPPITAGPPVAGRPFIQTSPAARDP